MNTPENWRPVPGWSAYQVSDTGSVWSVPRVLGNGLIHGGLVLAQRTDKKGYKVVTLTEGRRRRTIRVHVLVLLAFAGPPPEGKPQVRHLNGKPADNRWPRNLAYGDQADQEADKARQRRAARARRRLPGGRTMPAPSPLAEGVTLSEAVRAGHLGTMTLAAVRTLRARAESFPAPAGRRGAAYLYDVAALRDWVARTRPFSSDKGEDGKGMLQHHFPGAGHSFTRTLSPAAEPVSSQDATGRATGAGGRP